MRSLAGCGACFALTACSMAIIRPAPLRAVSARFVPSAMQSGTAIDTRCWWLLREARRAICRRPFASQTATRKTTADLTTAGMSPDSNSALARAFTADENRRKAVRGVAGTLTRPDAARRNGRRARNRVGSCRICFSPTDASWKAEAKIPPNREVARRDLQTAQITKGRRSAEIRQWMAPIKAAGRGRTRPEGAR